MNYGKPASGEKEPKGVKASDRSGEKMGSEKGPNSTKGTPSMTGAKAPAGATSSDTTGERKTKLVAVLQWVKLMALVAVTHHTWVK